MSKLYIFSHKKYHLIFVLLETAMNTLQLDDTSHITKVDFIELHVKIK